ncbi:amidase [Rhizobium pusense]|uniref:amidase n=1 Tax=Agrobacterium pusense TaxID=648995 RepID=UPI0024494BDB|nr:amidase [Agrobacterium pusense]MDH1270478.1 amidase [Agrobacterium pusense]
MNLTRRGFLLGSAAASIVVATPYAALSRTSVVDDDLLSRARNATASYGTFLAIADRRKPLQTGTLAGLAVSVKDDLFTYDLPTTAGSAAFRDFQPTIDAVPIARLRSAGAEIFAKCNLAEFAMHVRPRSPLGGECLNPIDPERTAGGSSGGSAAAVSAGIGDASIATDSGGSIRGPAAFCGVVGFAPSNGQVPKAGSFGSNLFFSGVGSIGASVETVSRLHQCMAGVDESDPETHFATGKLPPLSNSSTRWGWIETFIPEIVPHPDVQAVARSSADMIGREFGQMSEVQRVDMTPYQTAFTVISDADRLSGMSRAGVMPRAHLFAPETRTRLERAARWTGEDYSHALYTRAQARLYCAKLFNRFDFLLSPTTPLTAPKVNELTEMPDFAVRYLANLWWTNLVGCPAITIPVGNDSRGLPIGLQIVSAPGSDEKLLSAAGSAFRFLIGDQPRRIGIKSLRGIAN